MKMLVSAQSNKSVGHNRFSSLKSLPHLSNVSAHPQWGQSSQYLAFNRLLRICSALTISGVLIHSSHHTRLHPFRRMTGLASDVPSVVGPPSMPPTPEDDGGDPSDALISCGCLPDR